MTTKTLRDLLDSVPGLLSTTGDLDTPITAPVVETDADVQPGGVFVARAGLSIDGHDFIPRAIERGAAAVVGEHEITGLSVPYVRVEKASEAVGWLAAAYHDYPSRKMIVIGVTGTDGKTTTSAMLHNILQFLTLGRAGLISTVAAYIGGEVIDTGFHVTTPSAPQIQAFLARMLAEGMTHAVIEATSHGLAQGRLNGVDFDVAVLTNLTHEHLDYHGTFENYKAAKGRLFEMVGKAYRKSNQLKISVLNADDPNAEFFAQFPTDVQRRYSTAHAADVYATDILYYPEYTQFILHTYNTQKTTVFYLPLVGKFNVANALAAITAARSLGVLVDIIQKGVLKVPAIPGRLERIDEGQDFVAIVDFAHTPNALKNALQAVRPMVAHGGKLIAVFGSAGLRDREKRKLMAEIGAQLADFCILTAEDPRTESLDAILQTMADAAVSAGGVQGETFVRVPDRGEALYRACQMAQAGDVVIACGKGHEQSMCFGTIEYPWDDREALRSALRGSPPRTLPTAKTLE